MKIKPVYRASCFDDRIYYNITGIRVKDKIIHFNKPVYFVKKNGENSYIQISPINLFIPIRDNDNVTDSLKWFVKEFVNKYADLRYLMEERDGPVDTQTFRQWKYYEEQLKGEVIEL